MAVEEIPPASGTKNEALPACDPLTTTRPIKAIIVGAGISGITTAILLKHKVPGLSIVIYDRQDKVGGVWASNTYPGIRCDVPAHAYQFNSDPNLSWSEYYPCGAELQAYWANLAHKHGVQPFIKFSHQVLSAQWIPSDDPKDSSYSNPNPVTSECHWKLDLSDLTTNPPTRKTDHANFLINAQGRLSHPFIPPIPNLSLHPHVHHTAQWPPDLLSHHLPPSPRIAVIGNGATAQQIIPALLPIAGHITQYARSRNWIAPAFATGLLSASADKPGGHTYTREEITRFHSDKQYYLQHRLGLEKALHNRFATGTLGSPENEALRRNLTETMLRRLGGDKELLKRVLPTYAPGCKRLTPSPGYLEALTTPHVTLITTPIITATPTGLRIANSETHTHDLIILATGFQPGTTPLFPIVNAAGKDLATSWSESPGYPATYLGLMAPKFPNYFIVLGAQGNARQSTIPVQIEYSATWIAQAIRKVQAQGYSWLAPRQDVTNDFNKIVDEYFVGQVVADDCGNSWFKAEVSEINNADDVTKKPVKGKGKARVVSAWPGTFSHREYILRNPRWEDFHYGLRKDTRRNRFSWFGNGRGEWEAGDSAEERVFHYLRGKPTEAGSDLFQDIYESTPK